MFLFFLHFLSVHHLHKSSFLLCLHCRHCHFECLFVFYNFFCLFVFILKQNRQILKNKNIHRQFFFSLPFLFI
jgi:hypothetical protein